MNSRRVVIATLLGFTAGILCYLGGKFLGKEFNTATFLMILLHRTVLGFVIGISALRIHWAFHGILVGLIVGLPGYPLIYSEGGLIAYSVMGVVWGFIIEFLTSVVFKAKSERI